MASESETNEIQSILDRLTSTRNRDLSLFLPFLFGLTRPDPDATRPDSGLNSTDPDHNSPDHSSPDDQNQRDRIILINPLTQGMVVIEGTGLDSLFRGVQLKDGPPPASKSSIEAMPSVEIREGGDDDGGECVICLEEWAPGEVVKEMPCKHRFHRGCIEKWLGLHGSCPVCRFRMPVEEDEPGKKRDDGEERRRERREIWVSFSFGSRRREEENENHGANENNDDQLSSSSNGDQL